jgi:hypothetical protein
MDFDYCSGINRKKGKGIRLSVDEPLVYKPLVDEPLVDEPLVYKLEDEPVEIEMPNKKIVKQCTNGAKKNHPKIVNCCYLGCLEDNLPFDDVEKIARLNGRYYYFCDEYCYLTWLLMPSLIWL